MHGSCDFRNHTLLDGRLQAAHQTTRPRCHEGVRCHPDSCLSAQSSANAWLTPGQMRVGYVLRPCARRRNPIGSTSCLVNAACCPARQACARRPRHTWITAARAKPMSFRHGACRHGRAPLGRAGLPIQRDVRRSGCVCAALRPHGCQLGVPNRRLCALSFAVADCPTRQRRLGNIARRVDHRSCALCSVEARRAILATQREAMSKSCACVAWRQHGRQLDGVPPRTFAVSRVERLIRRFGRVVPRMLAQLHSTVLRALSCKHRVWKL